MAETTLYQDSNRPDFEKPLIEIETEIRRIEEGLATGQFPKPVADVFDPGRQPTSETANGGSEPSPEALAAELARLRRDHAVQVREIYASLTPWQIVSKVTRHPKRPQSTDYIRTICTDFCQLHGDRLYGDDPAILSGFGRIGTSTKAMVIAHRKGRDTNERMLCNFGCAQPWGYRKALKNMKLAEKFGLPIVTLVDTPGAYPGIEAEERGQAEAIARNLREMSRLRTPIISVIIGEGGSGGALGIAVADRVAMMEFSWYSVISPEGCAAILWKKATPQTNAAAADALHLTARENLKLGIIDAIIPEPVGGAHRDHAAAAESLQKWIIDQLSGLRKLTIDDLLAHRHQRLRNLGVFTEAARADESTGS